MARRPTPNAPATAATPGELQLPPAHVFDVLPALYELLARVDADQNAGLQPHDFDTSDDSDGDIGASYSNDLKPLNAKELPNSVLEIKARIRAALRELEKLPDMDRTVEAQEDEIQELEEKIKKQRETLQNLAGVAGGMQERLAALR